jgi:hypothetical protein
MMRQFVMAALATAAFGSASLVAGAPAQAQTNPLGQALARAQQVQTTADYTQYGYRGPRRVYGGPRYYGGYGGRRYGGYAGPRGYYGRRPYGYYRRDRGSAAAAGIAGLAAGALIGGAIASQQAQAAPTYVAPNQSAVAYCAQRYRSYDPASGTYLGYDGLRHPCP